MAIIVSFMLCVFYNKKSNRYTLQLYHKVKIWKFVWRRLASVYRIKICGPLSPSLPLIQGIFSPINLRLQNQRHPTVTSVSDFPSAGCGCPYPPANCSVQGSTVFNFLPRKFLFSSSFLSFSYSSISIFVYIDLF